MFSNIRYFLRSRFRNIAEEQSSGAEPEVQTETVPSIRRKKCGFCREEGHFVTACNNEAILTGRQQIRQFIGNMNNEDTIEPWLRGTPFLLLKAIASSFHIVTFRGSITARMLRGKVLTYILTQQATNIILTNRRIELNDRLHRIASVTQPVLLEPIDIYETLSIKLEYTSETIEPVQCPVCYDEITSEQKKMNCGHTFCGECTDKLLKNSIKPYSYNNCAKCPLCRERIHTIYTFVKPLNNIDFEL
jgi:hypothetical protein